MTLSNPTGVITIMVVSWSTMMVPPISVVMAVPIMFNPITVAPTSPVPVEITIGNAMIPGG
jgi:hypothetical protein